MKRPLTNGLRNGVVRWRIAWFRRTTKNLKSIDFFPFNETKGQIVSKPPADHSLEAPNAIWREKYHKSIYTIRVCQDQLRTAPGAFYYTTSRIPAASTLQKSLINSFCYFCEMFTTQFRVTTSLDGEQNLKKITKRSGFEKAFSGYSLNGPLYGFLLSPHIGISTSGSGRLAYPPTILSRKQSLLIHSFTYNDLPNPIVHTVSR